MALTIIDFEPLRYVPYSISHPFISQIHIFHHFILNHRPNAAEGYYEMCDVS
jgi:hypothetical protein